MANEIKARVGFDHVGADGEQRRAGDEVTVSYGEYLKRGPNGDGFLRELGGEGPRRRPGDPGDPVRELPPGTSIPVTDPTGIGDSATSAPADEKPAPQAEQIADGERRTAEPVEQPAKRAASKRTSK